MSSSEESKILFSDNILNKPAAGYEKTEMDLLRDVLNRSYTERFLINTRLYKIQLILNRTKITHRPYSLKIK